MSCAQGKQKNGPKPWMTSAQVSTHRGRWESEDINIVSGLAGNGVSASRSSERRLTSDSAESPDRREHCGKSDNSLV